MKSNNNVSIKKIGCTVEHRHTGAFALCDEDMIDDLNWVFYSYKKIKYQ